MLENEFMISAFDELFLRAKAINETQFLTSLFAFFNHDKYKMLSYVLDEEFQEVIDFINNFGIILELEDMDAKNLTRTRVLLYCHIFEVDLIYLVTRNLINTIIGNDYSHQFKFVNNKNETVIVEHPVQKIEYISKYSKKLGLSIHTIFNELYHHQIRNAFSHSQYSLSPDADFSISKYVSPSVDVPFKQPNFKTFFKYHEIEELYNSITLYLQSFIETYKKYISGYEDGNPHMTLFGEIVYDKNHGWIFYRQEF